MEKNVGNKDRILRILLGILIIALGIYAGSWWGLVGLILLVTGLTSFCGLYKVIGISTCETEKQTDSGDQ